MKIAIRLTGTAAIGALFATLMIPAQAADLGGGCCADLEERVAELEATTARKGNRTVSLRVNGQVSKGLLIWDDGVDSDAYVVDNSVEYSKFGFSGLAKIKPGWTVGYSMEFEIHDAPDETVTQGPDGDDEGSEGLSISQNNVYIDSEKLGRITIGHATPAADGATTSVGAESLRNSGVNAGAGLKLRYGTAFGDLTLGDVAGNFNPDGNDLIRYDSPSIYGFVLSASWGDSDYADATLKFEKEFKTLKIVAAIAYIWDNQNDGGDGNEQLGGSISVMHLPTGLYAAFQAASRDYESTDTPDSSFWYVQGGIEKRWMALGATTLYGEYGRYDDFSVEGAETTRWGFGLNQKIDSAAMDVYAQATFWGFDGLEVNNVSPEDMTLVLIGSRIEF